MTRKIVNNADPGTSTIFGGDDVDYINKYLTGVDQSGTDPVVLATTTTFKNSKLLLRNPADTLSYTIIPAAIAGNRNITLPLLTADDTLVTEAYLQTLTNKTIDAAVNSPNNFSVSPLIQRSGKWFPIGDTATASKLEGILAGHFVTGSGTINNTFDTTEGVLVNITSGASTNSVAGLATYTTGVGIGRRLFGMKAVLRAKIDSTTTSKFLFGFTSATVMPTTAATQPLSATDHGVIVGFVETGAGSTNWTIWHNDGASSVTTDDITGSIAKDTGWHTIEINWLASSNINVVFDGISQTISTDLPATTANLFFNCLIVNTASVARTITTKGIWIQADK